MAKSLQTFREWAVAQGRNIGNPGVNTYRGECVSLVQQYLYQVFDVPYVARGHAKDFVPPKFTSVGTGVALKPGDIVRYGSRFGNGYGHIELIDDDRLALGQNRDNQGTVTRKSVLSGYSQVFRPAVPFTIKNYVAPTKTNEQIADEVIAGKWGNGVDRQNRLTAAGYSYNTVQAIVNAKLAGSAPAKKSNDTIADEVIKGLWGNGIDRRVRLAAAGYDYAAVQAIVNRKLS